MRYTRFEWLTIAVGSAAVIGTIAFSLQPRPDWVEVVAQLLLLGVLIAAVHWGRNGGMAGALVATLAYVLLRIPNMLAGLLPAVIEIVLIRALTYGLVGIVGGEVCSRIKYFFVRLEDSCAIDEDSRVYNQRFVAKLIESDLGEARRYGTEFSVALITLSPLLTSELRPARARALVRTVADHIRNDVRLVDEVGRLDDGRFVVVLPHTPGAGGRVAGDRVRRGVRDVLGAKDSSVTLTVMGSAEDEGAVQKLIDALKPQELTGASAAEAPAG